MVYRISIAQFNISFGNPERNFEKVQEFIEQAAKEGCDLVLLPELWTGGYDYRNFITYKNENQVILEKISVISRLKKIIIAGSYLIEKDGKDYNSLIIHSNGQVLEHYEKLHLFSPMREDEFFTGGDHSTCVSLPWGKTGLAICYDLRFPELFRKYSLGGATVILVSSEWPLSRINHWQTLLRARAIENQVFIFACNSVGQTGKEIFGGCSAVIDPSGNYLVKADSTEECLLKVEIDIGIIDKIRNDLPVFKDRRSDIYG
jgi:omega-amidase